jgi:hypothetical protein
VPLLSVAGPENANSVAALSALLLPTTTGSRATAAVCDRPPSVAVALASVAVAVKLRDAGTPLWLTVAFIVRVSASAGVVLAATPLCVVVDVAVTVAAEPDSACVVVTVADADGE